LGIRKACGVVDKLTAWCYRCSMKNEELERILKEVRYNRQMQKKRLYEQARKEQRRAKRAATAKKEISE
jgi:hypothetical protein